MFRAYLIPMGLFVFGCSSSTTNEAPYETGGEAGQAGAGGSNSGGQAGTAGSNTGGGDSGVGGNSGGTAGVPSGGGTGGVCVPKTCATFSYNKTGKTDLACGVIQDGCGNVVDCGSACKDPAHICGGAAPESDGGLNTGDPNICGGGCTETTINGPCTSGTPLLFKCATATTIPPQSNCVPYGSSNTNIWCCSK